MSPVELIRTGLRALRTRRRWEESCPSGAPVPEDGGCAALGCDSIRLTALRGGERAMVTCLEQPGSHLSAQLAALGILPGTRLALVRRYPAFVFRVGHAELAVDEELAQRIRVRRE